MSDTQTEIKSLIETNRVVVFMKGTPEQPLCGFSHRVVMIVKALGVPFASVDVIGQPEFRDAIKTYSNWPTIPQLYVDGQFVGGSDIAYEMYQSGELQKLVDTKPA
jgi:monothiol glutaredoxin